MDKKDRTLSRSDTISLVAFVVAGAVIVVSAMWGAIGRIVELAVGRDVAVTVEFLGSPAVAQLPGGSLDVQLDTAAVIVPSLSAIGRVPGILGQVAFAVTIVGVVVCLTLLSRNLLRGRVFGRANSAIVATAGLLALIGTAAARFFDNMLANAAMAQLTDGPTDTAVISVEPFPFILAAFAFAVIGSVFVVGARLQRETEGLV